MSQHNGTELKVKGHGQKVAYMTKPYEPEKQMCSHLYNCLLCLKIIWSGLLLS